MPTPLDARLTFATCAWGASVAVVVVVETSRDRDRPTAIPERQVFRCCPLILTFWVVPCRELYDCERSEQLD